MSNLIIDASNKWYLIGSDPSHSINQTVKNLSSSQFDASLAIVNLGNPIVTDYSGGGLADMTDISTTLLNTLSNISCIIQGGTPFAAANWGKITDLTGKITNSTGIWVLTKDAEPGPDQGESDASSESKAEEDVIDAEYSKS